MIYLDTSAFLKLYIREEGSEVVQAHIVSQDEPIPVWDVLQAEFINALHLNVFWGHLTQSRADELIGLFDDRLRRGQYWVPDFDRVRVMQSFRELSEKTIQLGCRTMDILHVAFATEMDVSLFASFDKHQRELAATVGLPLIPA